MAMLAEPRSRKRYHLNPRGKALYEDDSRFGTKMLEKMGWSKGKGLGANEDGAKDFVRVRFKDDSAGLGFENDTRDDQWTSHEESFNGFLKSLNGEEDTNTNDDANVDDEDSELRTVGFGFKTEETKAQKSERSHLKEKISGISLEEKSANSRARVHYKKFTRGKDLLRYSEKDLANIFGRKFTNLQMDAIPAEGNAIKEVEEQKATNKNVDANFAGVSTISTGLSVIDYFKFKMESVKKKKQTTETTLSQEQTPLIEGTLASSVEEKQKTKKKKKRVLELDETKAKEKANEDEPQQEDGQEVLPKKKKKHKNKTQEVEETPLLENTEDIGLKQKKRTKKKVSDIKEHNVNNEVNGEAESEPKQSKSKHLEEVTLGIVTVVEEDKPKKNKCTSEMALQLTQTDLPLVVEETNDEKNKKTKNKKKDKKEKDKLNNKIHAADIVETESQSQADGNGTSEQVLVEVLKKSKKLKKNKDIDIEQEMDTRTHNVSEITQATNDKSGSDECNESDESDEEESKQSEAKFLSMEELLNKLESYNEYTISEFCAEEFRNFDLKSYIDSSLDRICGYGITEDIKLNVIYRFRDEKRLHDLWSGRYTKYGKSKGFKTHMQKLQRTTDACIKRHHLAAIRKQQAFSLL